MSTFRIDVTPTALHVLTVTDFGKTLDDFTITAQ